MKKQASLDASITSVVGKIFSVTVENFMTFDSAAMHPGQHLNILIGPNGTGKSSMVAAIVLGMGGSTKILSAKLRLQEYIKNGKDNARIIICLYKNLETQLISFERSFKSNGKSVFKIDGQQVTENVYLNEVRNLNIQVENMCQFLPQDRVQDFAKQNPQELLDSTQQSVCSKEIIEQFNELKKLRRQQLGGDDSVQKYQKSLMENEERLVILEAHVENIKKKTKLGEELILYQQKRHWVLHKELYDKCKKLMDDLKLANGNYKKYLDEHTQIQTDAKNTIDLKKKYEEDSRRVSDTVRSLSQDCSSFKEQFEKAEDGLMKANGDLRDMRRQAIDQERELKELSMVLKSYEQEFAEQADKNYVDRIKVIEDEIDVIKKKIAGRMANRLEVQEHINTTIKYDYITVENKLKTLESSRDSKLEFLNQPRFEDTYKAVLWLRKNAHHFRCKVYEPMLLELNSKKQEYSKYVENCVALRDLTAFTCEDADDMSLLIQKLQSEEQLNINVIHSEHEPSVKFVPRTALSELRQYGVEKFLLDCLDGPAPILNYLCRVYNIQNVVIGNQSLNLHYEKLPDGVQLIFTPSKRIQITVSKYSKQRSYLSVQITSNQLLGAKIDQNEINALNQKKTELQVQMDKMKNKRNQIESQILSLEEESKVKTKQKNDLLALAAKQTDVETKILRQNAKIAYIERNRIDVEKEKRKHKITTNSVIKNMASCQEQYTKVFIEWLDRNFTCEQARLRSLVFNKSCGDIEIKISESHENVTRSKRYVDNIERILNEAKQECKAREKEAMALTNNCNPSDSKKFPFREQFEKLPNNIDEIMEKISEIEGQIECMATDSERGLQEYEERLEAVRELKQKIENSSNLSGMLENTIDELHNQWYPKILSTIQIINSNFEMFMKSMECAGEVELIRGDARDYDAYGIEIRVKYRANEQLQALDRFVQSGGERAVAIAVYSLSLQQLTQVPFRCVDEINQGMDPDNERKIFDMLVQHVAQEGQSQFFYVTPKLLMNMSYNEYVSCSVVHNGYTADNNNYFPLMNG